MSGYDHITHRYGRNCAVHSDSCLKILYLERRAEDRRTAVCSTLSFLCFPSGRPLQLQYISGSIRKSSTRLHNFYCTFFLYIRVIFYIRVRGEYRQPIPPFADLLIEDDSGVLW